MRALCRDPVFRGYNSVDEEAGDKGKVVVGMFCRHTFRLQGTRPALYMYSYRQSLPTIFGTVIQGKTTASSESGDAFYQSLKIRSSENIHQNRDYLENLCSSTHGVYLCTHHT